MDKLDGEPMTVSRSQEDGQASGRTEEACSYATGLPQLC